MKYLLPCKCGQSVEVEPGQAGQTVGCGCGENLLVPSMLQVKALPVAPEKPASSSGKTHSPYKASLATLIPGILCAVLSIPIGWIAWFLGFDGGFVFRACFGMGVAFLIISPIVALRARIRPDDTNILSRTFFVLGIVLLFPSFILALHLLAWTPAPRDATTKRVFFSHGSSQKSLYQDSTPIPMEERTILWITEADIDRMTPMELHMYFQTLKEPVFSYNFRENYEAVLATHRIWTWVNIILFILAFSSIIVSFCMPKQNVVVTGWSGSEW